MSAQDQIVSSTPDTYEDEFQVERILDKKIEYGSVFYLIKWLGFEGQDTWEPELNLVDCPDLIKDFEARLRAKQKDDTGKDNVQMDDTLKPELSLHNGDGILRVGFERGLEAHKILGATKSGGKLCFLLKWKGTHIADIVSRDEANIKCPQVVIKFYEDRIQWNTSRTLAEILGEDRVSDEADTNETNNV